MLRFVASILLIAALTLGCSSTQKPTRPSDLVVVGADPNYPPFDLIDSVSGEIAGFDVDLVSLIVQATRWRHENVALPYDELLPALTRGDIDIVASAMPAVSEANADVIFSDPYYLVSRVLVLRAADSMITGLEDMPTGPIGVISGTNLSSFARQIRNTKMYQRKDIPRALSELADGTLAALIADYPLARALLKTRTDLRMCSASLGYEYYVFAMRRADSLRLKRLDDALAALLGGFTYEQLHQKCFGYPPLNLAVPDSVAVSWQAK
ncbi:MAG: ABC transporter substrate-binding protein [candidate division Zixibacteria bacterium]|nr:ABC transporter substrate-binding protein [candidate division Zixibacteria bacterium]